MACFCTACKQWFLHFARYCRKTKNKGYVTETTGGLKCLEMHMTWALTEKFANYKIQITCCFYLLSLLPLSISYAHLDFYQCIKHVQFLQGWIFPFFYASVSLYIPYLLSGMFSTSPCHLLWLVPVIQFTCFMFTFLKMVMYTVLISNDCYPIIK